MLSEISQSVHYKKSRMYESTYMIRWDGHCQGLGDGRMGSCLMSTEFRFCEMNNSGDWLYNTT